MNCSPDMTKLDERGLKDERFDDFERLANSSQDAIYHYDIPSKQFLFVNRRFSDIFRIPPDARIAAVSSKMI